jgi:hypothetical protein
MAYADLDGLVDKKGGPEDMYELAREADIVITCMTLNNESVNPSLCSILINFSLDKPLFDFDY